MVDQIIDAASGMITKWDPGSSTFARVTSLFYENKREAMQFLRCVDDLQKTMHLLVSENSSSAKLIEAQTLMQVAMKRLQKEFYQILSMNRAHLDPESLSTRSSRTSARSSLSDYDDEGSPDQDDNEVRDAGDSIFEVEEASSTAMADLKSIADCMINAGYTKECIKVYKVIRKSIIDEGIYRLGVERVTSSQINKMDWQVIDLKIKNWLEAVKIAMKTLFTGERILCDHVFASSESIRESCFTDISKEGAALLFAFPELVIKVKKAPAEKMFRVLDMYTAIAESWPEIESIFSFESTSALRSKVLTSLIKIGESVRQMILDFETHIQKDSSKTRVPGGGVHHLTIDVMNYLTSLADYSNILGDILADWDPPAKSTSSLLVSYFESPETTADNESPAPAVTLHVAWLIVSLLCKLDAKAKHYKDAHLAYLFLANNLQHVVAKVRTSNLQFLLGEEWINKNEAKLKQFVASYVRVAWGPVLKSLPENPTAVITPGQAKDYFKSFNSSFEHMYKQQSWCVVPYAKLREEIKETIARKLLAAYGRFYETHKVTVGERNVMLFVRFTPEDVDNYLSDLFFETSDIESAGSRRSSSSTLSSLNRRHSRLTI